LHFHFKVSRTCALIIFFMFLHVFIASEALSMFV